MNDSSELELINRCLSGEESAWNELFDIHYAATVRFVFQFSPELTLEDAEEITQETFLSVIKNLNAFNKKSRLQTWIFRIAINKTHDFLEKRVATKRGGGVQHLSIHSNNNENRQIGFDVPDSNPKPDEAILKNEEYEILVSSLKKLGSICRELIELKYFGDLSYDEIGQVMNMNPKTVSSRLSKCLDKLESIIKENLKRENVERKSV
ncbi:MAG: RNA polymerase sigma factor [Verrucomicrobiia bacterium]|jgi:RNA polymerase sigma-70 factor (ECF subfamily)